MASVAVGFNNVTDMCHPALKVIIHYLLYIAQPQYSRPVMIMADLGFKERIMYFVIHRLRH